MKILGCQFNFHGKAVFSLIAPLLVFGSSFFIMAFSNIANAAEIRVGGHGGLADNGKQFIAILRPGDRFFGYGSVSTSYLCMYPTAGFSDLPEGAVTEIIPLGAAGETGINWRLNWSPGIDDLGIYTITLFAEDCTGRSNITFRVIVTKLGINSLEITQAIQVNRTPDELEDWLLSNGGDTPVPIVAGKDAFVRIFLEEVSRPTKARIILWQGEGGGVDSSGFYKEDRIVDVLPGCSPDDARLALESSGESCHSVDFDIPGWAIEEGPEILWIGLEYYVTDAEFDNLVHVSRTVKGLDVPLGDVGREFVLKYGYGSIVGGFLDPDYTPHGAALAMHPEILEDYKFEIQIHQSDPLVLHAFSVCDAPGLCGDSGNLNGMASLLKNIAPTDVVKVIDTKEVIEGLFHLPCDGISCIECTDVFKNEVPFTSTVRFACESTAWWAWATAKLQYRFQREKGKLDNASERHIYYGVTRPIPGSDIGGWTFDIKSNAAASMESAIIELYDRESNVGTVAHEVGHAFGLRHTNIDSPKSANPPGCFFKAKDPDTDWDYDDNRLWSGNKDDPESLKLEVGLDIQRNRVRGPNAGDPYQSFEMMGYCYPRWVTPRSYNQLFEAMNEPLIGDTVDGLYWLLGAWLGDSLSIEPVFTFQTPGSVDEGVGTHRIEVQDASGQVMFTRFFTPLAGIPDIIGASGPAEDTSVTLPSFIAELIPVQAGAARISVQDTDGAELGHVAIEGTAPTVDVTFPLGGELLSGLQAVTWSVTDPDSPDHTFWLEYSADGGLNWKTLATSLSEPTKTVDFDRLPGSDGQALIRVLATDGINTGTAVSNAFSVPKKLPEAKILFPEAGAVFHVGQILSLEGFGFDSEDGTLEGTALSWESVWESVELEFLGIGDKIPWGKIVADDIGTYTATLTASDKDGNQAADSVTFTIASATAERDSDGDGVPDGADLCADTPAGAVVDTNGCADSQKDDDGDDVNNTVDNCPAVANPDQVDVDGDGIGDACDPVNDLDLDGDGFNNDVDNCPDITNPDQTDSDGDGIGDACDPVNDLDLDGDGFNNDVDNCPDIANADQADADGDGIGYACDPVNDDVDGDGIYNDVDNCPDIANADQADVDGDGIGDACDPVNDLDLDGDGFNNDVDNCPDITNPDQTDSDGDGIGDACDADDDNDSVVDGTDNCPLVPNTDQLNIDGDLFGNACDADLDGDTVANEIDNCPANPNLDQTDTDGDLVGDECDANDDNDMHLDANDNCPTIINDDQADLDGDGIGDVCDADIDGDGINNNAPDNCPLTANPGQDDTDGDSQGDACDSDDDNDTYPDVGDNCPLIPNDQSDLDVDGDGDACDGDLDGDGHGNANDNCPTVANSSQNDFDLDGMGDACDADIDGDGVSNSADQCASTPAGAVINPSLGCSIAQLCPCDGPRGTTTDWRNHGKYVSCIAKTSESFVDQGLITDTEKDVIVSTAAGSSCGNKK